ncbi:hypothetical protein [Inhella crocodyli]|uniref:Uncharacterized protein n=1 Tax=Inhella crocodyli TaxID=2499851 RepID=A0A3S2UI68_9BURK|nr:hypothetical protein [Inhella crocodyli]RVT88347.1 hypothetical protein EOD73_05010 [Inhella crocodyli]
MTEAEEREWIEAICLEADKLVEETGMDWFVAAQRCMNRSIYEPVPAESSKLNSVPQIAG